MLLKWCLYKNVNPPSEQAQQGGTRGDAQRGERWTRESTSGRARPVKVSDNPRASLLYDNDPSAGSPTETLLRLLLPLNDQV